MPRKLLAATLVVLVSSLPLGALAQSGFVSTFSAQGDWNSSFPVGLASSQRMSFVERDTTGRIYVGRVDNSHGTNQFNPNDQIAVFSAAGAPLQIIKGATRLQEGLTFDSAGNLYFGAVPDGGALGDKRVYKFSPAGAEITSFGSNGNEYTDFVTAPGDRIFAMRNNARDILEFTTAGALVNSISAGGRFGRLMAIDPTGTKLWTYQPVNGPNPPNNALIRYDLSLNETVFIDLGTLPSPNPPVAGLEVNAAGEILLLLSDAKVLVLSEGGTLLRTIQLGGLGEATNLALAADGRLLVGHNSPVLQPAAVPTLNSFGLLALLLVLPGLALAGFARVRRAERH